MSAGAGGHLSVDALLGYWLNDAASAADADAVDEHLLQCDACGETLDELVALGDGVRAAFRAGAVSAVATAAFVERLAAQGLRLRAGELREPGRVLSYVLGTCRMTVMEQRRGERRRAELLERYADDLPAADVAHVAPRLDEARVADCLERLPERERAVLVMTFYDERPSEAVGIELGLTPGNVRVIRHRGIDRLRRCVDAGRRLAS